MLEDELKPEHLAKDDEVTSHLGLHQTLRSDLKWTTVQ